MVTTDFRPVVEI